ncbi:MAG TPA: non-homologous end-joining DNA ligase [Pseudomonadales bacterium]
MKTATQAAAAKAAPKTTEKTAKPRKAEPPASGRTAPKGAAKTVSKKVPKTEPKAFGTVAPKAAAKTKAGYIELRGVRISHPERVIDAQTGLTKGQLAEYYDAVAPFVLRSIANHPVTLIRCPDGIGGEMFYQRNPGRGLGPDVCPLKWHYKDKDYEYLYIRGPQGLLELVQMNVIEFHPWGTRYDRMDYPDKAIFDLDPDTAVPFEAVKLAALDLRQRLENLGLESFLRVTGGKGVHVIVPLAEKDPWDEVKEWTRSVAEQMAADVPDAYVSTMTKAKRAGKIFVDFFRNDYTATAVGDFSVRARPGAPVAVPLEWKELDKLDAANQFSVADVLKRIKRKAPDDERYRVKQRIPSTGAKSPGTSTRKRSRKT